MSDGFIGYDPELVAQLDAACGRRSTTWPGSRSADPAAADAVGVVSTTRIHLESSWLPVLDRIAASQAMAAPIEAMSIDEVLDFLRDDPLGELIFDLVDVADEGDLDEVDGNWSTRRRRGRRRPGRWRGRWSSRPWPGGSIPGPAAWTRSSPRSRPWRPGSRASDEAWEGIDDEVGWYEDVADVVVDVAADVWDRASTYGQYLYESGTRMAGDPLQTMWDVSTGTVLVEQVAAAEAILVEDGELYADDDGRCGEEAECITGARPLPGAAATTFGHTVVIEDDDPSDRLVRHEMQHVDDIETVGAGVFYTTYVADFAVNMAGQADDVYRRRAPRRGPRGRLPRHRLGAARRAAED